MHDSLDLKAMEGAAIIVTSGLTLRSPMRRHV